MDRFFWHPLTAGIALAWFIFRVAGAPTGFRIFALVWCALWFALAVANARSGGRLLARVNEAAKRPNRDADRSNADS